MLRKSPQQLTSRESKKRTAVSQDQKQFQLLLKCWLCYDFCKILIQERKLQAHD